MTTSVKSAADLFRDLAGEVSGLSFKPMFGWTCTFYEGKMQGGYWSEQVMLRLAEEDRTEFLNLPNAEPFNPKGDRPMKEYVSVPTDIVYSKDFASWFEKSLRYVAGLPPKEKRTRAKRRSVLRRT